jgi:pimeloyl-ACP methyl ester carboxylesterase
MNPPPVQYVRTSDGMDVAYSITGSGVPLVVMPDPVNHLYLRWQRDQSLRSLAAHFTVVQFDSRGQGMSTRGLSESHRIEDYILDLEAVVARSGFEKVVLLGNGFLANVAVSFAVASPQRIDALILVNARVDASRQISAQLESLAETDWPLWVQVLSRSLEHFGDDFSATADFISRSVTQADWLRRLQAFKGSSLAADLPKVSSPTLVLANTATTLAGEEDGRRIASLIPGCRAGPCTRRRPS